MSATRAAKRRAAKTNGAAKPANGNGAVKAARVRLDEVVVAPRFAFLDDEGRVVRRGPLLDEQGRPMTVTFYEADLDEIPARLEAVRAQVEQNVREQQAAPPMAPVQPPVQKEA